MTPKYPVLSAYPVLATLMAKYNLNKASVSELIGLTYRNTIRKLNKVKNKNGEVIMFSLIEAGKIAKYFRDKGENIHIEDIFLPE
jgi:hypothetical protein